VSADNPSVPEPQEPPKSRRSRLGVVSGWVLMAAGLAVVCSLLTLPGCPLYTYELKSLDSRFRFRSEVHAPEHVAIVAIDERSITDPRLGRWPWDRKWHAQMLRQLEAAKPRAVAFDVIFAEPSSIADDNTFAEAVAKAGNVFFGLHPGEMRSRVRGAGTPETFARQPGLVAHRAVLPQAGAIVAPLAAFAKVAAGGGVIAGASDPDGIMRRALLFVKETRTEALYPTLVLELARHALGLRYADMQIDLTHDAKLGPGLDVLLDSQGRMLVNFIGPADTVPARSYVDVLDGRFNPRDFQNKVVIVGFTAPGLLDQYPTPVAASMSGIELQAQALEGLMQGRFLKPPQFADTIGLALVLAVIAALAGAYLRPLLGGLVVILLLAGYNVASLKAFTESGAIWGGVAPNLAVALTFVAIAVFRLQTEEKARRRLRDEFGRYAPPQVVARLDAGEMKVRAAGVKRPVTALFADVRGFTAWSASADPHEVIQVLNTYFESVTQLAFDVEGTIDNIVGDEIFVTFNALQDQRDHAQRAVDLGLNMIAALDGLNERWVAQGILPGPMRIGVGIHTGEVLVGSLGSHIRTQYTALGQTINLASRLQSFNKELGTTMLTTREVADQLGPQIETHNRGFHDIRGHPVPVEVIEIVGRKTGPGGGMATEVVPPAATS
jgi:adenylate cyclase